eukprot:snap_masked-scaffold_63-processed-gene-0.64-mRNA-1 protein AED:0.01 eAED:0.01 QI:0/-1/0/1/-1/1/1/0/1323
MTTSSLTVSVEMENENVEENSEEVKINVDEVPVAEEYEVETKRWSPEVTANVFSRMTFYWAFPLLNLTKKKNRVGEELSHEDLYWLPASDGTKYLSMKLNEKYKRTGNLRSGILNVVKGQLYPSIIIRLLNTILQFSEPLVLNQLLLFIEEQDFSSEKLYEGYFWGAMFGVLFFLRSFTETKLFWLLQRCGWKSRSAISSIIYKKSLRISPSARQSISLGKIVNVMQLDATKIERLFDQIHVLWDGLLQICGYITIIYFYIGSAVFAGVGIILFALPLQVFLMSFLIKYTKSVVVLTDSRVKTTNEALQSILGVKLSAWEQKFMDKINSIRTAELSIFRKTLKLKAFAISYVTALPALTAVTALAVYANNVDEVKASTVFSALQAFNSLRAPLLMYPMAFVVYADALISYRRIKHFLELDETEEKVNSKGGNLDENKEDKESNILVSVKDASFQWVGVDKEANGSEEESQGEEVVAKPVLEKISFEIKKGSLVGVVGAVGTGKSSLLSALLGELIKVEGDLKVADVPKAYASQTPWILNASVRENIVFSNKFDETRYRSVIDSCELSKDFKTLKAGDFTIIGENGVNLSGGQAQRVSLARTAYSFTEFVILDDPFSALDPEVANKVFEKCVLQGMNDRTVIMALNQLSFLKKCDYIIVLEDGTIKEQGSYNELMTSGNAFASLVQKFQAEESDQHEKTDKGPKLDVGPGSAIDEHNEVDARGEEERQTGAVKSREYLSYIKASGGMCWLFVAIFLSILNTVISFGNQFVVSFWTNDPNYEIRPLSFYLQLYVGSAVLLGISAFSATYVFLSIGLAASKSLHGRLLDSIFHAPVYFFDITPTGRILSRFSKDLFSVDSEVPMSFNSAVMGVLFVIIGLLSVVTQIPFFLAAVPFVFIVNYYLSSLYRPVARDSTRLEAIARSPIYAHFSETLTGLSSIRSYKLTKSFAERNETLVDRNVRAFYVQRMADRWFGFYLQVIAAILVTFSSVLVVYAAIEQGLEPGFAGLAISLTVQVSGMFNMVFRSLTTLEKLMNSVERINYYSKEVPQERKPPNDPEGALEAKNIEWPSTGQIEIKSLEVRYRTDTPLVLKGLDVVIPGGSRVGVVGRSGEGKSSTFMALLRIIEAESGHISIDEQDISALPLETLRKGIAVVPQSPFMFSGSIKSNLDPFEEHTPEELWRSLALVNLSDVIESLPDKLEAEVSEYGENFSQGQRQLICMARTLLAKPKILLLDEATSSIDYETDSIIQKTIRENFVGTTILTIAHRVQTIIDNDFVLVISGGRNVEFGKPTNLLSDRSTEFSKIVSELGSQMEKSIRSSVLNS